MSGLRVKKNTFAKFGNVITQPLPTLVQKVDSIEINDISATANNSVTSLNNIVTSAMSSKTSVTVFPSSGINVHANFTTNLVLSDQTDNFAKFTQFSLNNDLIGISKIRPEIVSLMSFLPIYDDNQSFGTSKDNDEDYGDDSLNDVGIFLDDQIQLRNLLFRNIISYVKQLRVDTHVDGEITDRKRKFKQGIEKIKKNIDALSDLFLKINKVKLSFDLTEHNLDLSSAVANFGSVSEFILKNKIDEIFDKEAPSFSDILVDYGFSANNFQKYTSTKVYLQTIYEFLTLLRSFSKKMLSEASIKEKQDVNSTTITKFDFEKHVNLRSFSTVSVNINLFDDLFSTIDQLNNNFAIMKLALPVVDEDRVSLLLHLISKEFNISYGLQVEDLQETLRTYYGYEGGTIDDGTLFESIVGNVPNKITDKQNTGINTLVSLAQIQANNTVVLPFENKFLDASVVLFTPGSDYFFKTIFENGEFSTQRLTDYVTSLNEQTAKLTEVVEKFNLLGIPKLAFNSVNSSKSLFGGLQNSSELIKYVLTKLSNPSRSDSVIALFKLAQNNATLKSLLYTYYASRAPNVVSTNDAKTAEIADKIIQHLKNLIPASASQDLLGDNFLFNKGVDVNNVKFELNTGDISIHVIQLLDDLIDTFSKQNCFDLGKTNLSRIESGTLCALFFEAISTIICKSFTFEYAGSYIDTNTKVLNFVITNVLSDQNATNTFKNNVKSKLSYEYKVLAKTTLSILSMLVGVRNSCNNFLNALQSSHDDVEYVSSLLQDDNLLSLFIDEQQILLAKSRISDVTYSLFNKFDVDTDEVFASTDVPLLLDDAVVTSNMRNALLSLLSSNNYLAQRGSNLKILTVGIPYGFSKNLKERVKISDLNKNTLSPKEKDVVNIVVYKRDLEFQDLIFKPQKFLFELSRFVPRHGIIGDITPNSTVDDILKAVQTLDFSFNVGNVLSNGHSDDSDLLPYERYNFLTSQEKRKLILNHVSSYLFEVYCRLLTGLSLTENTFSVSRNDAKNIEEKFLRTMLNKNLSEQFNRVLNLDKDDIDNIEASDTVKNSIIWQAKLASTVAKMSTSLSDVTIFLRKLITPCDFERVFNIPIDPDDFEIDVDATMKTTIGKTSFNKLLEQGKIINVSKQFVGRNHPQYFNAHSVQSFKLKERDIKENYIALEKYFISVETFGGTVV